MRPRGGNAVTEKDRAPNPAGAVFLSYASADAAGAERIAGALRAAGIEVWLDKSELRGGDSWDRQIRRQIRDCTLFVPIISANSQARPEGYFRLEWDLADQRTHLMGRNRAFVLPVCTDATPEREADVPDSFLAVQWMRLPDGETPAAFVERVRRLLAAEGLSPRMAPAASGSSPVQVARTSSGSFRSRIGWWLAATVLTVALGYLAVDELWLSRRSTVSLPAGPARDRVARASSAPAFAPPPHSIAVLPFVNMSGDKEQEYFSDGLTEELLNSLSRINELQVAARTSSFSFKGEKVDVETIAHKLHVAAVLEGSVRRSGHTVRITAQLINAVTGFHLWSQTYDRDLGNVLKLQTDIATAVASALSVTLLGGEAAKIESGGTHNPAAFDAYLRASRVGHDEKGLRARVAAYSEAITLDPHYARAFAHRSLALNEYAGAFATGSAVRAGFERAEADAHRAIALAPGLADGHVALEAFFERGALDFTRANAEYERALALAPGDASVLGSYGQFAVLMGRTARGLAAARRAVGLDPLNDARHAGLAWALLAARHYDEAIAAFQDALALAPDFPALYGARGAAYYLAGDLPSARASCESKPDDEESQVCLAVTYHELGRHPDAESALAKLRASLGNDAAYEYAEVYAQWGDRPKALEWLEMALRLQDSGLPWLRMDPFLDPLRNEPRFQSIEQALKFP
jgi:TolB-like protein/tetratricopeptide (TPR) repeat protein